MLKQAIKNLPNKPGIYQYFDSNNKLLYIGKAKSLKNRVKSYFKIEHEISPSSTLSPRIHKMICETAKVEYILVESEHDALILENSLIKQLKPKYNILLRDDKTYPYIYVDLSQNFPRFDITRKIIKGEKIKYFGPFSSSARPILDALYMLFPLVQKKGCLRGKKSCLYYQLNRCLAPCEKKISAENYLKIVNDAINLINDRKQIVKLLNIKMQHASTLLNFEEAARLRDMQASIKNTLHISQIDLAKLEDFDIFAVFIEKELACALRLFIREGKVVSTTHTILNSSVGFDMDELYERLLFEYYNYQTPHIAKNILLANEIQNRTDIELALSKKCDFSFKIQVPKIGSKKHLCDLAIKNAQEIVKQTKNRINLDLLKSVQELLELDNTPFSIEIFDNSHLIGEAIVGAMVVFENNGFQKNRYRHFHLKAKNEYYQMRELLIERVTRFEKEAAPNLWVIDGGEALRSLADNIIQSVGANVDVVAISKEKIDAKAYRSKGSANDIIYTKKGKISLSSSDTRLQFLQKLRDEAHRFAITFHRKMKQKMLAESSSLKNAGLNDAIIKKLIGFYGTFEKAKQADEDTLDKLFSKQTAKKIKKIIDQGG